MSLLSKQDLLYGYSWTAYGDDDPRVTGEPDSTLFNRKEGYEVLYLINKISEDNGFKNKKSGLKIEKMINENLPGDIRSQKNVVNWVASNWN